MHPEIFARASDADSGNASVYLMQIEPFSAARSASRGASLDIANPSKNLSKEKKPRSKNYAEMAIESCRKPAGLRSDAGTTVVGE